MNTASWTIDPVTQVELYVPSWSTPDRVVARAAVKRDGRLRLIRFSNDWTHPWPLWEPGSERYNSLPEDLGLSVELAADLQAWHAQWELEGSRPNPWSKVGALTAWEIEGERLAEALQEEVWEFADVLVAHAAPSYVWADRLL